MTEKKRSHDFLMLFSLTVASAKETLNTGMRYPGQGRKEGKRTEAPSADPCKGLWDGGAEQREKASTTFGGRGAAERSRGNTQQYNFFFFFGSSPFLRSRGRRWDEGGGVLGKSFTWRHSLCAHGPLLLPE